ncbi:MMPL family transporter [Nocardioides sp. GCM10030258]|uniref:MMPL family transporter n=1 Tax=unclassified Nocardioides TaxID=2615069 RepID=UPI0036066101
MTADNKPSSRGPNDVQVALAGRARKTLLRRGAFVLILIGISAFVAGGLTRLHVETTVNSTLALDDPAAARLTDHARSFGGDPIVVILESGEPGHLLAGDGQLLGLIRLEGELARLPDVAAVYGPGTILNQIATVSQNLLVRIGATRDAIRNDAESAARAKGASRSQAKRAADAASERFDRRYGALIAQGLPAGLPTMKNPKFAETVIFDADGRPRPRWQFVVPDAHNVSVLIRPRQGLDEAGNEKLVAAVDKAVHGANLETSRVTITGIPAITSALTQQAASEIPLLGGLATLILLARFLAVPSRARRLDRLWPLAAALVGSFLTLALFGWTGESLSFAAIALLPLLLGIGSSFSLYLTTAASRRDVLAVSLASAAAFSSLTLAPLPFVHELGIALGLGVMLTVGVTLAFAWALRVTPSAISEPRPSTTAVRPLKGATRWTSLTCLAVVAATGWASLPRLDVVADPQVMAQGLPELESAHHAEQVLGSSGEVSVVLRGVNVQTTAGLDWLVGAQDVVVSRFGDQLRPILTAPDLLAFLGDKPTGEQIVAGIGLLPPYLSSAVLTPDSQEAVLSFGLKLQDLGEQSDLLEDVEASLPPPPRGTSAELVGLPVAASHTYEAVADDRWIGNIAGVLVAGLVLAIGLRHRRDAALAVGAALLATGWTLAGLAILDRPLNPMTITLGSLATVTACEFTVLLAESRRIAAPKLAKTVTWACVTSAVGYLALVPSRIALLREFGITLAAAMILSYVAAIVVVRLCSSSLAAEPCESASPS